MKKNLLCAAFLLTSVFLFSQTEQLDVSGPFHVGMDVGFSNKGYMPVGFHFSSYETKFQFGFTVGVPVRKGTKGEYYSTINWDEYPEDIVGDGEYYTPFTVDVGYKIYGGLIIGAGIGYASKTVYRNMYDSFHILGYNGSYHITLNDGGVPEYKGYVCYYFPADYNRIMSWFIKGSYSYTMGAGLSVGVTL